MMEKVTITHRPSRSGYDIVIGSGGLERAGEWLRQCLDQRKVKAAIVSNPKVFGIYGEAFERSLVRSGFNTSVWLMRDGERYKDLRSLAELLRQLSIEKLTRNDVIIALGGGVVGDLAGFAAAVYMRGVRFVQVPTTLLAMIDSSVGGKTGINTDLGKNLVGAFHHPSGVLIDTVVLQTLPRREVTAGLCEAVKQATVSGPRLFEQTSSYLETLSSKQKLGDKAGLGKLIAAQVKFKASIVRQDQTESIDRTDAKSRKILNFGHTVGHALEKATNYRYLRHGEAVGYGILAASQLSKNLDLLGQDELKLLNDVVRRVGRLPDIGRISPETVFEAIKFDKKALGGKLNWVLLKGIGKPVIVSEDDIPRNALTRAVKTILKKN